MEIPARTKVTAATGRQIGVPRFGIVGELEHSHAGDAKGNVALDGVGCDVDSL